ncbi:unnamed protein product [Prorocentrum cordatum]|uniref:Cyclic nucleotide-binding domain-containing protein n=1 Tax=Prorocentrum cordatum TaxID=2364126 RepID=A0ABN9YDL9_9DINO|nr:unnamed protein product [Polarella glacialis]
MWPRVFGDGDFWGEDMILMNSVLRDDAAGRALTHLEIITLEAGDLIEILPRFPREHQALCRARTKMAIARAMRKISWSLAAVRADAEKERTYLALDDGQVQGLIASILRDDGSGGVPDPLGRSRRIGGAASAELCSRRTPPSRPRGAWRGPCPPRSSTRTCWGSSTCCRAR